MKRNKKGFTLVELVIVIAVIAILAGVMIAVFSGVIKRANDNAELQQVKNDELKQKAEDVLTKLDNANWFSWEDFENSLAAKLTEAYKKYGADGDKIADQVEKAVKKAIDEYAANSATSNTSLTETQVKVIVENALANAKLGGVTEEQVRTIVNTAVSGISTVSKADIQRIVDAATAKGLTAEQVSNIIGQSGLAKKSDTTALSEKVDSVIAKLNALTPVTKKDVEDTIIDLVPVTKTAADKTEFETLVGRLNSGSTIIVGWDAAADTLTIDSTAGDKVLTIKGNKVGTLEINAPKATIYLLCDVNNVNVVETAQNSVHVLGNVTNLEINKGRVVLESGAKVVKLKAAPSTDAVVTVVIEQNSEITEELETEYQDHGYTEGKRDYIVIENNGDVEITNLTVTQKLAESKTTTTNVVIKNSDGSTGTKVENIEVAEDVGSFDITVDDTDAIANASKGSLDVALFAGGDGTSEHPYIITTAKQWNNFYQSNYDAETYPYYKLGNDIDFSKTTINNTAVDKNGVVKAGFWLWGDINGNGHKLTNISSFSGYNQLLPYVTDMVVHDITLNYAIDGSRASTAATSYNANGDVTFRNVTVTGTIATTADWATAFVAYPRYAGTLTYDTCVNRATLTSNFTSTAYAAPFGSHDNGEKVIKFINCANYGTVNSAHAGGIVGMVGAAKVEFADADAVKNYGAVNYSIEGGNFTYSSSDTYKGTGNGTSITANVSTEQSSIKKIAGLTGLSIGALENFGDKLFINAVDGATKYSVTASVSTQVYNYDDNSNANIWSGGFPRSITVNYSSDKVVDGVLTTDFIKGYIGEADNQKLDYQKETNVSYNGIFVGSSFDLYDEYVETIIGNRNTDTLLLVSSNDKTFYYLNMNEYGGLLTTTQQNDNSKTVTVTFSVTASDDSGSILSTASSYYSYTFTVSSAKSYFGN